MTVDRKPNIPSSWDSTAIIINGIVQSDSLDTAVRHQSVNFFPVYTSHCSSFITKVI